MKETQIMTFFSTVKTISISGDADIFKHLDDTTTCFLHSKYIAPCFSRF